MPQGAEQAAQCRKGQRPWNPSSLHGKDVCRRTIFTHTKIKDINPHVLNSFPYKTACFLEQSAKDINY